MDRHLHRNHQKSSEIIRNHLPLNSCVKQSRHSQPRRATRECHRPSSTRIWSGPAVVGPVLQLSLLATNNDPQARQPDGSCSAKKESHSITRKMWAKTNSWPLYFQNDPCETQLYQLRAERPSDTGLQSFSQYFWISWRLDQNQTAVGLHILHVMSPIAVTGNSCEPQKEFQKPRTSWIDLSTVYIQFVHILSSNNSQVWIRW